MTTPESSPFHPGEQAVQARLDLRERMEWVAQRAIRDSMPEQHQQFYAQLPFVLTGSVDGQGRPWASVLVGEPGFMQATDPRTLDIRALPMAGDPLGAALELGTSLGFLGIELHTRRRNRINGRVTAVHAAGFAVSVEQTLGNCPKYIQGRECEWRRAAHDQRPRAVESLTALDEEARAMISKADTFFVATHAPAREGHSASTDVSHRGGRAGFVRIEANDSLLVPDFIGNNFFMTLGNLQVYPRAGVLFMDFIRGDLLMLSGAAEIVWEGESLAAFDGAQRAWRLRPEAGVRLRDALPLRWTFRDWSPASLSTGCWLPGDS